MSPDGKHCTILIVGQPNAAPIRMSLSRRLLTVLLSFAAVCALVQIVLIVQVTTHLKEIGELRLLRSDLAAMREQKATLLQEMAGIKRQVLAIKSLNWRFGVMLGEETARPNDPNGLGGEESVAGSTRRSPGMEQELAWLKSEAVMQERLLRRHVVLAEEKSARWASTPTIRPVKGPITSGFGERLSPFSGEPAQHNGVDIGASTNTPIIAPAMGKVVVVRYDQNMGNVVKIDHGFDYQTEYRHLEKALVREGQPVKRGEIIGQVGNTGLLSTGPHLHYQVFVNDRPVNPLEFFFD